MRGTRMVLLAVAVAACGPGKTAQSTAHARDSGFAGVQARGAVAMGVNQYTSHHVFEPLDDGGRIALERDAPDSAGAAQIRRHMQLIADRFAAGDFALPGFVHARGVPGTEVMSARRAAITYAVETLPRGAALRIQTADSAAIGAIHEFLAFQRQDHHAGAHRDS
jgi:hypothetical protein